MSIGIFGYDFDHYKTTSILKNTVLNGHKVGAVFLAPKINYSNNRDILSIDYHEVNQKARDFCIENSIQVFNINHNDEQSISSIVDDNNITLGLIGGAKIIPEKVINLFKKGIINYHPGKIPETSGLDSLYRTIERNIPIYITAHLIDSRIDAGLFILESKVKVLIDDTPDIIRKRIIAKQIELNHQVLNGIKENLFNLKSIIRSKKNEKLSFQQKEQIMQSFENWKYFIQDE
jgi:folate-dependent phosphoribosylglycinamide formyltransferase PurN